MTVDRLMPYANELVFADSSASIKEIQTLILARGVSLIPIIDQRKNVALVRRKGLWNWMLKTGSPAERVKDVKEPPLPEVSGSDELAVAMKKLRERPAVIVRAANGDLRHLITPRVVANALRDYSERFRVIERLEGLIRDVLERSSASTEDVAEAIGVESIELNQMTFAEYHTAFSKLWDRLGLNFLDRRGVLRLMDKVREFRNAVMHFRMMDDERGHQAALDMVRLLKKCQ